MPPVPRTTMPPVPRTTQAHILTMIWLWLNWLYRLRTAILPGTPLDLVHATRMHCSLLIWIDHGAQVFRADLRRSPRPDPSGTSHLRLEWPGAWPVACGPPAADTATDGVNQRPTRGWVGNAHMPARVQGGRCRLRYRCPWQGRVRQSRHHNAHGTCAPVRRQRPRATAAGAARVARVRKGLSESARGIRPLVRGDSGRAQSDSTRRALPGRCRLNHALTASAALRHPHLVPSGMCLRVNRRAWVSKKHYHRF